MLKLLAVGWLVVAHPSPSRLDVMMYAVHREYILFTRPQEQNDIRVTAPHVIDIVLLIISCPEPTYYSSRISGFSKQGTMVRR